MDAQTAQKALAYACLILADDDLSITADNLISILRAANVSIDGFMPGIYEQAFKTLSPKQLITSFSGALGGVGGGAQGQSTAQATSGKFIDDKWETTSFKVRINCEKVDFENTNLVKIWTKN